MTWWDPDGPGPSPQLLVAGGRFVLAGGVVANSVAAWDGQRWLAFGDGIDGTSTVHALVVMPNGDLVAAGHWGTALPNTVARWNGVSWQPLGSGLPGVVSLELLPNGDLVAGGFFNYVARWDGTAWSSMGVGPGYHTRAFHVAPDGSLLAASRRVMRWNGVWEQLGPDLNGDIYDIVTLPTGEIVIGGAFNAQTGPADRLAQWDGTAWVPFAGGADNDVYRLELTADGHLMAMGSFSRLGDATVPYLGQWDSKEWSAVVPGLRSGPFDVLPLEDGSMFVAGGFMRAGDEVARGIAHWDAATQAWSSLDHGTDNAVLTITVASDGAVYAGGRFRSIGGTRANGIARRDGNTWIALGEGLDGDPGYAGVMAAALTPTGSLVVGGHFTEAGGRPAGHIAQWDGNSWSSLSGGVEGGDYPVPYVFAVAVTPVGEIIAGGSFHTAGGVPARHIARWDGESWHALGMGMAGGSQQRAEVRELVVLPNGDVIAGGNFSSAGGVSCPNIARWDGSRWWPLGSGPGGWVHALYLLPDGNLAVGGDFRLSQGGAGDFVALWNGSTWRSLGSGLCCSSVYALTRLPNGDLVAGGRFTSGESKHIRRWDGSTWMPISTGTNRDIWALNALRDGTLLVGGEFSLAGGMPSAFFATYGCVPDVCRADFNADGLVTSQDFFDYLTAYFASLGECPKPCGPNVSCSLDFDDDCLVTSADLFAFLDAFFQGCE